jgi:hypothetical protein
MMSSGPQDSSPSETDPINDSLRDLGSPPVENDPVIELHFEEIAPPDESIPDNPDQDSSLDPTLTADPSLTDDDIDRDHEPMQAPLAPTSSPASPTQMKHRWMIRAFFASLLALVYLLIYWQASASK